MGSPESPWEEHIHISVHAWLLFMGRTDTHFRTHSIVAHDKNTYTLQNMLGCTPWDEHIHTSVHTQL